MKLLTTIKHGFVAITLLLFGVTSIQAQQINQPGGPYDADANTVVLLDFDQDRGNPYENLAGGTVGDAQTVGSPTIVGDRPEWEYGSSVSLNSGAHLKITDANELDITGDWTIEVWVKINSGASGSQDIIWKPNNTSDWWQGNYFIELRDVGSATELDVSSGTFDDADGTQFGGLRNIDSDGAGNRLNEDQWYHITYIRDTGTQTHYQIVHDVNMNHLWTMTIGGDFTPRTNSSDLFIGSNGNGRNMNGLLNQLRLSNTARTYAPIIKNVSNLENPQSASSNYAVTADVDAFPRLASEAINTITLNYNNGTGWQTVSMSNTSGNTYQGTIPQQTANTVVEYYVSATNNAGQKSVYPFDAEVASNPALFSFVVEPNKEKVLFLDFEEGTGTPSDKSSYNNDIAGFGSPAYASQAKRGDYALEFDGTDDMLQVLGPISDGEFTIDFWLKAGDFSQDWEYIVAKPAIEPQLWGETTFEIYANPASKLTAGIWNQSEGSKRIELIDTELIQGNWYRVIMQVREAPELAETYGIFFRIHDSNDNLLEAKNIGFNNRPAESRYPLRLGKHGGSTETPPYFDGAIDDFTYYNYARSVGTFNTDVTGQENWRMLSSPVENATFDDLLGDMWTQGFTNSDSPNNGTSNVLIYDANVPGFVSIDDQTDTLEAGKGYLFHAYSDDNYDANPDGFPKTMSLYGFEHEGPVTVTTVASQFNFLGNPFSSSIDADNLSLGGTDEVNDNWNSTVYVYDPNKSGGADYISYNGETGDITDGLIAPYQGFFVESTAGGTSFELPYSAKASESADFYGKENTSESRNLKLTLTKGEISVNNYLSFSESGKTGMDAKDAYDLPSMSDTFMSLFSITEGNKLEINNLPFDLQEELVLPMDFDQLVDGERGSGKFELSWPEMNNIPETWEILLKDRVSGEVVNLRDTFSYTFEAENAEKSANKSFEPTNNLRKQSADDSGARFTLGIYPNETTSLEDPNGQKPSAIVLRQNYPNPFNPSTEIGFELANSTELSISVFNITGQKVAQLADGVYTSGEHSVTWNAAGMPSGIYLYKIQTAETTEVRKMTLLK